MKRRIPATSSEAYRMLTQDQLDRHYGKIIAAFKVLGSATADKIAEHTGMDHNQVNRRFKELRTIGVLYRTEKKLPTRQGRNAYVHTLIAAGKTNERKPETVQAKLF